MWSVFLHPAGRRCGWAKKAALHAQVTITKAASSSASGCAAHLKTPTRPLLHAEGAGMHLSKCQRQLTVCIITSYSCNPWHCSVDISQWDEQDSPGRSLSTEPQPTWNAHTSLNGFEFQKSNHLVRRSDTVPRRYFEKIFILIDLSWRWRASWRYAPKMMWKDSKNLMQETHMGKLIKEKWDGF